jgi:hypothetical protein
MVFFFGGMTGLSGFEPLRKLSYSKFFEIASVFFEQKMERGSHGIMESGAHWKAAGTAEPSGTAVKFCYSCRP